MKNSISVKNPAAPFKDISQSAYTPLGYFLNTTLIRSFLSTFLQYFGTCLHEFNYNAF